MWKRSDALGRQFVWVWRLAIIKCAGNLSSHIYLTHLINLMRWKGLWDRAYSHIQPGKSFQTSGYSG